MSQPFSTSPPAARALAPLFRVEAGDPLLAMMLTSGGDERISPDGSGRNRYGASARPREDEICFASSTASTISARGWDAAASALPLALLAGETEAWFSNLRRRLLNLLAPRGTEAAFCASGTQTEYAALVVAGGLAGPGKRLVNLIVGPEETGRGAPWRRAAKIFSIARPSAKPGAD